MLTSLPALESRILRLDNTLRLSHSHQWQVRQRHTTSKYTGVSWSRAAQKFQAQVWFEQQQVHVGIFDTEIAAARAYDERLRAICNDAARLKKSLNFPTEAEDSFTECPDAAHHRAAVARSDRIAKEEESFRRLLSLFWVSPEAQAFELLRVSGSSRIDAIFQLKNSLQGGLPLQLKCASPSGREAKRYVFQHTHGYAGMLLVLLPLDQAVMWAVPGDLVTQTCLSVSLGTERDLAWRAFNIAGSMAALYRQKHAFPHVSLEDARLKCNGTHKVEELAHALVCKLFSSIALQLRKSFTDGAAVDSMLVPTCKDGRKWRIQEKSCNCSWRKSHASYSIHLWRDRGAPGRQAYEDTDFDILLAAILEEGRLVGLFIFPVSELVSQGLVGQKPTTQGLYPPWIQPKRQATLMKQAWQLKYFVDLRSCLGELPPTPNVQTRLKELLHESPE